MVLGESRQDGEVREISKAAIYSFIIQSLKTATISLNTVRATFCIFLFQMNASTILQTMRAKEVRMVQRTGSNLCINMSYYLKHALIGFIGGGGAKNFSKILSPRGPIEGSKSLYTRSSKNHDELNLNK